jgi:alpha-1,3-rhamnosyl/mannosyltransferase
VVPWLPTRPVVLTIHDLRPVEHPDTMGRFHGAYLRARLGPSVRAAAVITTPSRFVRSSVIRLLDAEPDRVHVVSAPPRPARSQEGSAPIDRPFFLYPATTAPHKNHAMLLEAFRVVVDEDPEALLILTGSNGEAAAAVDASIARLGLADHVRRLGRVPEPRLQALFRSATALTYPSTYEGFGLPLIEAMALGCPVIASNVTAMPEVVDDAGVLLDPADARAWAGAMLRLRSDDAERARLIGLGRARAGVFSPEETARRQVDAYRTATAGR